jgi:hypothetical protein
MIEVRSWRCGCDNSILIPTQQEPQFSSVEYWRTPISSVELDEDEVARLLRGK